MSETLEQQLFFMRWAIQLGEKGRVSAPPNPWVGCVIEKNGEILAVGYHEAVGKKHAEAAALEKAGVLARGATAYVSLEPCAHQGRTPPCVNALIDAGIRKVVIPLLDPDPLVSGKGVDLLRKAGIEVIIGVGAQEAAHSLRPYLHHRTVKRAFCVLKTAISLDGRISAADGSSQWITGEEARADLHLLRAHSQAILIGSQTALIDSPRLTVRGIEVLKQPLRVLLDSKGRVPPQGHLADLSLAPTLIFTASTEHCKGWEKCGVEVIVKPKLDLQEVLEELGRRQVIQVLVEGGGQIYSSFLKQCLADQLIVYIGNCLLGDRGKPWIPDFPVSTLAEAPRWKLAGMLRFGNDIRLDYTPHLNPEDEGVKPNTQVNKAESLE